jgi:hypothetical protein
MLTTAVTLVLTVPTLLVVSPVPVARDMPEMAPHVQVRYITENI